MTPDLSNAESSLGREESLRREHTKKIVAFIDDAYESIEHKDPKSDGDLLIKTICDGLEDAENGLRDDINPVRIIQRLWDQAGDSASIIGLGLLIEIAREEKEPNHIKEYKKSTKYVDDLAHRVFCSRPRVIFIQDDESSITTILTLPLSAEDILPGFNISNETRRGILNGVYQEIKLRNENEE